MSSLVSSWTDFQLIASVNLTTSIYIISSFTLSSLIKSRIEDIEAWQMSVIIQSIFNNNSFIQSKSSLNLHLWIPRLWACLMSRTIDYGAEMMAFSSLLKLWNNIFWLGPMNVLDERRCERNLAQFDNYLSNGQWE